MSDVGLVALRDLHRSDPEVVSWILSDVEFRSAVCRLAREGSITEPHARAVTLRMERLWSTVQVVSLVGAVKQRAKRLLGVHPLRAADALQLGAAITAVYDDPVGWEFVCVDERLGEAARREGFSVLP